MALGPVRTERRNTTNRNAPTTPMTHRNRGGTSQTIGRRTPAPQSQQDTNSLNLLASQFAVHTQQSQRQVQFIPDSQIVATQHVPGNQQHAQQLAQESPAQGAFYDVEEIEETQNPVDDTDAVEGDEERYSVLAPSGIERARIQTLLDNALQAEEEERRRSKRKGRRYDTARMRGEFEDEGEVWSKLISITRLNFCRFIHVRDESIPALIRQAAGKDVEASSDAYAKSYDKILEWRKNWYYQFTKQVEALQFDIETNNAGYAGLPDNALRDAYTQKFTFEAFHSLMGTTTAVVDWRATLEIPKMKALYKTLFVYSLIYTHQARHNPTETSRKEAKERIRLIMFSRAHAHITVDDLVLRPVKPPRKVRKRRDQIDDLLLLDETFMPFEDGIPQAAGNAASAGTNGAINSILIDPDLEERMEFIGSIETETEDDVVVTRS